MAERDEMFDAGAIGFHSPIPDAGLEIVVFTLDGGGDDRLAAAVAAFSESVD